MPDRLADLLTICVSADQTVHIVQEQISLCPQTAVCFGLYLAQEGLIQLVIRLPAVNHLIEQQVIRRVHAIGLVHVGLHQLLSAILVYFLVLDFHSLHTMLDLMLHAGTKALGNTLFVLGKGLVQRNIRRGQRRIAFLQDAVRADHAAEGQTTQNDCRRV